ncbi:MAG: DNA primase [Bacteroidales bacterium]|nr:DNA primase [Bacteroidales bacterium]
MIDQATIQRILDAAQITEVVSDFVTLRKRGANYVGLCPFHSDKTPSFYVSPSKNICKCFACGEGGTAVHFIMKHEQLSYHEALKYLAKKYGIEVQEREVSDAERQLANERDSMFIVNAFAQDFFSRMLHEHQEGRSVGLPYFRERGIREDIIKKFQLGYSPEQRDALVSAAVAKGFKAEYLERTGLIIRGENNYVADRFRGRVIFPVHTLSGKVVAFGGRILKKEEKLAKYINSPESEIYHKSNELYGIYFAKQAMVKEDKCFLVEGYTDVISMHQAGIEHVIASSGTALTMGQIRLIHRFTSNITVLYDGDAAGIKAALRGIDLLLEEGMNVKVVLLPDGEDPDSFSRSQSASSFRQFLADHEEDFIRFKTRLLLEDVQGDPIRRSALISDVVQSISVIPDAIARSVYVQECSRMLEIDERVVLTEVNKRGGKALQQPVARATVESVASQPAPDVAVVRNRQKEKLELDILRFLVRYGKTELSRYTDEETNEECCISVGEFILSDLEADHLVFSQPLYQTIADELKKHLSEPDFVASRFFLAHPDEMVSRLAAQLVSEKYQLSKIHTKYQNVEKEEDRLIELVPRVLMAYKDYILQEDIRAAQKHLKDLSPDSADEMMETMARLQELVERRKLFSQRLGERIVLKF